MVFANTPDSSMRAASRELASADFTEGSRQTGEDQAAHAPGRTCKTCGHVIEAGQDARRRGESDWAHDVCPAVPE
jgi:hypothetical protein